jgi:hypothetical protein
MADNEFVREWTAEEAAERGVQNAIVAPRAGNAPGAASGPPVSDAPGAAAGADHRAGIAPATGQNNPAYPPRRPAGNTGVNS